MTELHKTNISGRSSYGHVPFVGDTIKSDIAGEAKKEHASAIVDRPKSGMAKKSAGVHMPSTEQRCSSEFTEKPLKRQVSFKLNHQTDNHEGDVAKQKGISRNKKPIIRQCSFQHGQRRHDSHTEHDSHPRQDSPHKKKSLADMLPELMQKFKTELGCKSFIVNTKRAVERKRQSELEKPKEREWMKGSEMQAFYHTWQTSDDHLKDQSVRPRTVKRVNSLPKNFRMAQPVVDNRKPSIKDISDFGIVRECCSHPRMRIPSLPD